MKKHTYFDRGVSLTEVVVVLAIIIVLGAIFLTSIRGLRVTDSTDRVAQSVYNDLILIRSRAISTNSTYRIRFSSQTQWLIEQYDAGTSTWTTASDWRNMPGNTNLTSETFANAGANLQATPRGLFEFQGASVGNPYITIETLGATKTKSIHVDVGGAIEFRNN